MILIASYPNLLSFLPEEDREQYTVIYMDVSSFSETLQSMRENSDIQSLYNKIMERYSEDNSDYSSAREVDGYYHKLYAPGYEENGVAEVVAKCI